MGIKVRHPQHVVSFSLRHIHRESYRRIVDGKLEGIGEQTFGNPVSHKFIAQTISNRRND